ncbi:hypothetical protein [Pelagerythrobacter sp.]|uniref:hypothetical protein n=1 Tax=Pelagerythrobacter sp. TaxID=2800702 RepID=UPI0035B0675E
MSRIHLVLACALLAAPLSAQDTAPGGSSTGSSAGPDPVDEAFDAMRESYGPPPPEPAQPDCEEPEGDEIVVCARLEEQSQFRVRSDDEAENEYAAETMNRGNPPAPDVGGPGIFRGPATVGKLCIPGLQKCPPPPAYIIDFDALPDAPPGSDADRAARGLAPRGNDGDFTPEPPAAPEAEEAGDDAPE